MLRGLWATLLGVLVVTGLGIPVTLISLLFPGASDIGMRAGRIWSHVMVWALGVRVRYHGVSRLQGAAPFLMMCNHQSNLDIWVLARVLPLSTRFVAKQSLFRIPVFGWALSATGFIPIDRSNRTRAIRSLEAAAEKVRSGRPIMLFPEGTRSRDGKLRPFKKGPFHLAMQAGVPVIPISISGTRQILPPGSFRARPGEVQVRFLEPIDVAPYQPRGHDELRHSVRESIARGLTIPEEP